MTESEDVGYLAEQKDGTETLVLHGEVKGAGGIATVGFRPNPRSPTNTPTLQVEISVSETVRGAGRFLTGMAPDDVMDSLESGPAPGALSLLGVNEQQHPAVLQCAASPVKFVMAIVVVDIDEWPAKTDLASLALLAAGELSRVTFQAPGDVSQMFYEFLHGSMAPSRRRESTYVPTMLQMGEDGRFSLVEGDKHD